MGLIENLNTNVLIREVEKIYSIVNTVGSSGGLEGYPFETFKPNTVDTLPGRWMLTRYDPEKSKYVSDYILEERDMRLAVTANCVIKIENTCSLELV